MIAGPYKYQATELCDDLCVAHLTSLPDCLFIGWAFA